MAPVPPFDYSKSLIVSVSLNFKCTLEQKKLWPENLLSFAYFSNIISITVYQFGHSFQEFTRVFQPISRMETLMFRELQHLWWFDWPLTFIFQWHSSYKLLQGNIILKICNYVSEISIVLKYVTITAYSKFSEYITTALSFVAAHSWEIAKGLSIIKFLREFCIMWISQAFKSRNKTPFNAIVGSHKYHSEVAIRM